MQQIILLHGALGCSQQLEPLSDLLTKKGLQTFLHNFSGHGKTPFSNGFGVEEFTLELKHLIEKNNLKKPHVFGFSMGGYVAMNLARTEPDMLGKIITLGTKYKWNKEIAEQEERKLHPAVVERKIPKFAHVLEQRHGDRWKELMTSTAHLMMKLGEKNLLNPEDTITIKNQALIGIADKDEMVSLEETIDIFRSLHHGAMFMLPCSAHQMETVNLNMLTDIIYDFIVGKDLM